MRGWEDFVNDTRRCTDLLVKTACAAFGFVYLHPFLDGNGRLHRFLIQHVLARSTLMAPGTLVPVSAVIEKNIPAYSELLTAFSRPVTALWDYRRGDQEPIVISHPGSRAYRFLRADREVAFLHDMVRQAVREEIPQELAYLKGYDAAFSELNDELDLPQKDLSALIRMIQSNRGRLSAHRRKQYGHLPAHVLDRIEEVVGRSFQTHDKEKSKMRTISTFALIVSSAVLLAACSSTKLDDKANAPVQTGASNGADTRTVGTVNAGSVDPLNDPQGVLAKRSVYFDYDSYTVKPEYRTVIENHAKYLVAHKDRKVIIQGNTDDRGGAEYNLALGQKRAEAVRKALVLLGVSDAQVEAVSFGKEKPKALGQDEASYAENRRADIAYQ